MFKYFNYGSYSYQFSMIIAGFFPFTILGEVYSANLLIGASTICGLAFICMVVAIFIKNKTCPKWFQNSTSDILSIIYMTILPWYILKYNGMVKGYGLFIFGMITSIIALISNYLLDTRCNK